MNKLPTILIVGAGIDGLSFYQSIQKNLGQKFNVKIFERENEGVNIQWGKKYIEYEETEDGVWVLFENGTREF
ncbi:17812_t:CDS:2, partial [Gigaspora margarita]